MSLRTLLVGVSVLGVSFSLAVNRSALACDVDGLHAAASATARSSFSVGGAGVTSGSSMVTPGTGQFGGMTSATGSSFTAFSHVSNVGARSTNNYIGAVDVEGLVAREEVLIGELEPLDDPYGEGGSVYMNLSAPLGVGYAAGRAGRRTTHVPLIDTSSTCECLLQKACSH